ncbi:hypothetical protein YPPY52_4881, partial [Yersinia pestis PY-52]
MSTVIGW